MVKKTHKRISIRLDPDNDEKLREISGNSPLKPSVAKLANLLIRNHADSLIADNEGTIKV